MKIPILCPLWGHEHLPIINFMHKIRLAGYDGIDTWLPESKVDKLNLYNYLEKHEMYFVAHQHEAEGSTFQKFRTAFIKNLKACAEEKPILINSHTGRDYFTQAQNLVLIEDGLNFSEKYGVMVCHETHRGRFGYAPSVMGQYFALNKDFMITADFSHWVCVTESMLANFSKYLDEAIKRSRYIHARVGFENGPQVTDPRDPEWEYTLNIFLNWWDKIVETNVKLKTKILPITTEFGPPPYMSKIPYTSLPVSNQFEINCFMKDLLKERYKFDNFSSSLQSSST